ncbi:hypothetical protein HMPREF0577_1621 [Mobiluncus mulieris ATCC 35243]|nr:hypothetical protein HMPREF0577_1621 [Mobiluncus mulieris ATCC 35243]
MFRVLIGGGAIVSPHHQLNLPGWRFTPRFAMAPHEPVRR